MRGVFHARGPGNLATPTPSGSGGPPRRSPAAARAGPCRARGPGDFEGDPYRVLGVMQGVSRGPRGADPAPDAPPPGRPLPRSAPRPRPTRAQASRSEIRAAYRGLMKELHPDVAAGEEDQARAVEVIAAYAAVMGGRRARTGSEGEEDAPTGPLGDAFDFPDGDPDQLFVDPFACLGVDPMQWRALQEVVKRGVDAGRDPFDVLSADVGVSGQGAVEFLTPEQVDDLTRELEGMEQAAAYDTSPYQYYVQDAIARARRANNLARPRPRWDP